MLSNLQKSLIHDDMHANPALVNAISTGDDTFLADYYNTVFSPAFYVWRTNVSKEEYQSNTTLSNTSFNWSGTGGYIARSQGERDAWNTLFSATGFVNPSRANVRAAFNDIFSGTGASAVANRTHLETASKRTATLIEKLLAVGTGTEVSPATLSYEGPISPSEISEVRVYGD